MYSSFYETAIQGTDWVDDILLAIDDVKVETPVVKYEITHTPEGVVLSIWEPAKKTQSRLHPYLYRVNYRLDTEIMAQTLLEELLSQLTAHC